MTTHTTTSAGNFSDYINSTTVFGSISKVIYTKDFKGGKVRNIFGETILDFINADIRGVAVLDISQGFGEVRIVVPADWRVETDISQFLATVEDRRRNKIESISSSKVLILTGFSTFANIEIANC